MTTPQLSVIIVTHNSRRFLLQTLASLYTQTGLRLEIIVVDNASSDGTQTVIKQKYPAVKYLRRRSQAGFSAANNLGVKHSHAKSLLFLNPDITFLTPVDLKKCLSRLSQDPQLGCLTPRVQLALSGQLDVTCHRGFPTPWAAFTHFSGLSRLLPRVPLFNQYTKSYLGYTGEHEIDAVGGMFMLIPRSVGDAVGWWDEDYPFYGEDLDFCYRIQAAGYRNWYYPAVSVLHYKGASTGMSAQSREVSTARQSTTRQVKLWSIQAMETFYRKHYRRRYPSIVNWLVRLGLKLLYLRRVTLA